MSSSSIDVLIPVYNAASTLDASLASIVSQTFRDFRVVIVDDGSQDDSPMLIAAWAAQDPRVDVIRQPNGGIVSALNAGLDRCSATYVARFDADDIAFPCRLALQRDYLEANPGCVGVGCAVEHIDETGAAVAGLPQPGPPGRGDPDWAPAREPYIIHPFLMARREAIVAIGGYRPVPQSEDSDLYWRLSESGTLHNLSEVLGKYRVHQHSLSGLSIVNGRIMAVGSQLGALSARRRRAGKTDIKFEPGIFLSLRNTGTLEGMCAHAALLLRADEMPRFRLGVAVKLLELVSYRPYSIERSDCVFIRRALAHDRLFSAENRGHIRWHVAEAARRLMRRGEFALAFALTPPRYYPRTFAKAVTSR